MITRRAVTDRVAAAVVCGAMECDRLIDSADSKLVNGDYVDVLASDEVIAEIDRILALPHDDLTAPDWVYLTEMLDDKSVLAKLERRCREQPRRVHVTTDQRPPKKFRSGDADFFDYALTRDDHRS
jgi:hypothetical protein